MRLIEIEGKKVGDGQPVFIMADVGINHMGDINIAKKMIEQVRRCNSDCVKFQYHLPDEEMLPTANEDVYKSLKKYALTLDQHEELKRHCEKLGIIYLCTPFSYKAAKELKSIGLRAFKIGSGELTDLTSLKEIVVLGNPLIVSTGMSTFDEIKGTHDSLKKWGAKFAFAHCVSEYPPLYEDMNLGFIRVLQREFPDIIIGHSDHTPDLYTSFAAVTLGAKIIEKHVVLDRKMGAPDEVVSIDMKDLVELVEGIRKIEVALGSEKKVHEKEKEIREWAFRSVVTTRDIPAGTILKKDMLWTKRPGTGIPSRELPDFIGKKTRRDLKVNTLLKRGDVE